MGTRPRIPIRRRVLTLAIVCAGAALAGLALAHAASGPATASVRGVVHVLHPQPLLGLREASNRSGALIYVTGFSRSAPREPALLNQHDEQFEPRLLPIVSGQTVRFPNLDRIYHNVFSVSPVQSFDLGQYKSSDAPRDIRFEKPGLVPVFCNIHPQMISTVVVLENDAFALSAADGSFAIENIPPGTYALNAWMPGAQRATQPLDLPPGAEVRVELTVAQTERIAPHKRKDGSDYPKPRYEDE